MKAGEASSGRILCNNPDVEVCKPIDVHIEPVHALARTDLRTRNQVEVGATNGICSDLTDVVRWNTDTDIGTGVGANRDSGLLNDIAVLNDTSRENDLAGGLAVWVDACTGSVGRSAFLGWRGITSMLQLVVLLVEAHCNAGWFNEREADGLNVFWSDGTILSNGYGYPPFPF